MIDSDAQRFRQEAQRCLEEAKSADDSREREAWLNMAAEWVRLAEGCEAALTFSRRH